MSNLSLYTIDQNLLALIDAADENGEIDSVAFDSLQMAKKDKMINIVHYVNFIEGNVDLIDLEIKRLQNLKKSVGSRVDSLKRYAKHSMELEGLTKMDLGTTVLSVRNNAPALIVDDESLIPSQFKKTVEVTTVDKMAIKEFMKSGTVEGCHLESTTSLTIK